MDDRKTAILKNAPKPFIPAKLPIDYSAEISGNQKIFQLLLQATQKFGEYKGYLASLINPNLLISPLIVQEAVLSSRLEGTHATLDDLLKYDAEMESSVDRDEMREVANYRTALYYALDKMSPMGLQDNKLPLTGNLIRSMHAILLDNVRGSSKRPGEYKRQQNYIGGKNGVTFTPLPANLVPDYIANLEKYIHDTCDFHILLQTAVIHAQFEMIHPFEDGNGRIGRLLIPLFLYYRGELPLPTFYMSSYFNRDRALYLQALESISSTGTWSAWLEFFLNGVVYAAEEGTRKAIAINRLYDQMKLDTAEALHSSHSIQLLDFIFQHPVFKAKQVMEAYPGIPRQSVYNLLNRLCAAGILQHDGQSKNRTYVCRQLVQILQ